MVLLNNMALRSMINNMALRSSCRRTIGAIDSSDRLREEMN